MSNINSSRVVFGIIHYSSNIVYSVDGSGRFKFLFTPLDKTIENIFIITKRKYERNQYAWVNYDIGVIDNVLGDVNNKRFDVFACLYQYNHIHKTKTKQKVNRTKSSGNGNGNGKKDGIEYNLEIGIDRVDLKELYVVSVDDKSTKDIDDAIHAKYITDTILELGIHIADVSSVVGFDTDIEKNALNNFSTFYFHTGGGDISRADMLPKNVVDMCSLNEGEIRNAVSTMIYINDENCEVISIKVVKSVIINKRKMTYSEFESDKTDKIMVMKRGEQILKKIFFDDDTKSNSYKTIETLMMVNNSVIAYKLRKYCDFAILRIHNGELSSVNNDKEGVNVGRDKGDIEIDDDIVEIIKMKNMQKGMYVYSNNDITEHKGIGLKYYTHFTSPIRRYIDLWNHYILSSYISGNRLLFEKMSKRVYSGKDGVNGSLDVYLNSKNDIFKRAYRDLELMVLYHDCDTDGVGMNGIIVDIEDNRVGIYIKRLKRTIYKKIIYSKILELFTIEYGDDRLVITKKSSGDRIVFCLYDRILVKLFKNKNKAMIKERLFVEIVDPPVSKWILYTPIS